MEYIFMANETKFKKNITIGVTCPMRAGQTPRSGAAETL